MPGLRGLAAVLVVIVLSTLSAAEAVAQPEPCEAEYRAARLLASLSDIARAAGPLHLLNGKEDPKMKRLLQWQLATAAADARRLINDGAKLFPSRATSLGVAVSRAIDYVAANPIDREMLKKLAPHDEARNIENPAENLAFVAAWIEEHNARIEP